MVHKTPRDFRKVDATDEDFLINIMQQNALTNSGRFSFISPEGEQRD
jgi:hypothetical protein